MLATLFLCLVIAYGLAAETKANADKPDAIIMLFVDDLGYGDPSFNGHPTNLSPNIDKLARAGKILTNWYSGCPVCSGSRAALMTGRQFYRVGVPGVFGPTVNTGLPLNETTLAQQAAKAGYKTAAMGKWHLGQRSMFLPAARGFDKYLGIPYSDDMGEARRTPCNTSASPHVEASGVFDSNHNLPRETMDMYIKAGLADPELELGAHDPAGDFLPLVYQERMSDGTVNTTVIEQPLDFSHLAEKYNKFVLDFVDENSDGNFFLYMPFSHVHTTAGNQPEKQYKGCQTPDSIRGPFGSALWEVDWIVGNLMEKLEEHNLNPLIFFTGDNGPWLIQHQSSGSEGPMRGIASGYWNTGKGSTWEGGIREAGFAYWPGHIAPDTRSPEVVSSMDVLPTLSALLDVPLPNVTIDGRDMSPVIFDKGPSNHEVLFFYGGAGNPGAARMGPWKAHWATAPGLGGCHLPDCKHKTYDPPLLFNVDQDPSESFPLTENGQKPTNPIIKDVLAKFAAALEQEQKTMFHHKLIAPPDGPGEGPGKYGVCCDRSRGCDCDGKPSS
eukprot:m.71181 g.71181  ORF g.71181 m.71181 type:complete len:554 (+) comp20142_c0_seq1:29-1690(+)